MLLALVAPSRVDGSPNVLFSTGNFLGDGQPNIPSSHLVPVDMSGVLYGKQVTAIATGDYHTLVLATDGRVYAWGDASNGALGNGANQPTSYSPVAVDVSGVLAGKTIVAISAGERFSLALDSDGKVYAWGRNNHGQVGNGMTTDAFSPLAVNVSGALAGKVVTAISASSFHAMALTSDGQIFTWGWNLAGQLGNGSSGDDSSLPVAVNTSGALAGKTVTRVSGGFLSSAAVTADGGVYTWGLNNFGQLGRDSTSSTVLPGLVNLGGATATAVSAGFFHMVALGSNGQVYAWGAGDTGALGAGDEATRHITPEAMDLGVVTAAADTISAIEAGKTHTVLLGASGNVYACGDNTNGRLGVGSLGLPGFGGQNFFVPQSVPHAGNILAITAGTFNTIVLSDTAPDVYAPIVTIDAQPTNPSESRTATFAFSVVDNATPAASLVVEVSLDGAPFATGVSPKVFVGLADGAHTFRVRATDAVGNAGDPVEYAWSVEPPAPDTTITSGPSGVVASSVATFEFTSSESGATFAASLDGAAETAVTSPVTFSGLGHGPHSFSIHAIGSSGKPDPTPATAEWAVQTAVGFSAGAFSSSLVSSPGA